METEKNLQMRSISTPVLIGILLAAGGLVVYLLTMGNVPFPGDPTQRLLQHLGIDAFPSMNSMLWGVVISGLALVSGSAAVTSIHLFSAVCAGVVLYLVYDISRYFATRRLTSDVVGRAFAQRVGIVAGSVTVLYLAFSKPFWIAATRSYPHTFNLILLLLPVYLLCRYRIHRRTGYLFVSVFLYGIGITQFSTMILLAPLYGLYVLFAMWEASHLRMSTILQALGVGVLGLLPYLVQAGWYFQQPASEWREFGTFWKVFWIMWRDQYLTLTGGIPKTGWLTVLFVSALPWLLIFTISMPVTIFRTRGSMAGIVILNGVLSILVAALLFRIPIAPWEMTGLRPLLVMPYLLIASCAGFLAAFWYAACAREHRFSGGMAKLIRRGGLVLLMLGLPALVVVGAVQSIKVVRPGDIALFRDFSRQVLRDTGNKQWLITNTALDDQVMLQAHLEGRDLHVIRLSYGRSDAYMKYVASLFNDPRYTSLAQVGMAPLLDEWMRTGEDLENTVSILNLPDLWVAAGYEAIPNGMVFNGVRALDQVDADQVLAETVALRETFGERLIGAATNNPAIGSYVTGIRTHLSKVANNLGVIMEDLGRLEDAVTCYELSREYAEENISALLNLHALAKREDLAIFAALDEEFTKRFEGERLAVQPVSLAYTYGYVRFPEAYAKSGLAWAMSGKANMAIRELKRAASLATGEDAGLQLALGGLYFSQSMDEESRESFLDVLETKPGNPQALAGLMRLAVRNGNYDEARGYLEKLKALDLDENAVLIEEAVLEITSGNPAAARDAINRVLKKDSENQRALALQAALADQLKDDALLEKTLKKLESLDALTPGVRMMMAEFAVRKKDFVGAETQLNEVLRRSPGSIPALESLLKIQMYKADRDAAEGTIDRILRVDPRNALANYLEGTIQVFNEQYALAEASYRASLATARSPEALNDLAWVLLKRGSIDEALTLARESLDLNERNSSAWDTYGVILLKKGALTEAEDAIQKALALRPNSAVLMLHLALVYEKMDKDEEAQKIANDLLTRQSELFGDADDELRDLINRLRTNY